MLDFLNPLRPGKNPILRREMRLLRHDLLRQPMFWVVVAAVLGHAIFSALHLAGIITGFDAFSQYYVQFTFFHAVVYLGPPLYVFWSWKMWRRSMRFEEMMLTAASPAEIFWAFVVTRAGLLLGLILVFYLPMLPWENWWLVVLEDEPLFSLKGDTWTRFHFLITWGYFISYALFGTIGAIWIQDRRLRSRAPFAFGDIFGSNLPVDLCIYVLLLSIIPDASAHDLIKWPGFLMVLLELHATPWIGLPIELGKFTAALWMARSVIRRLDTHK